MHIRAYRPTEHPALLALWERAVCATHTFFTEADIVFYRPLVAEFLAGDAIETFVLADEDDLPIGFVSLTDHAIEALFLEPARHGQGGGRRLVTHAQKLRSGALTVDVNEQNLPARGFYEALGFDTVGRSPVDGTGRPYPLVHLRREAHGAQEVAPW